MPEQAIHDPSEPGLNHAAAAEAPAETAAPARKRPKPGERRVQILQTLAVMLEAPRGDKITTAALAARLDVSEAALYRHFASKAQMFEGLIEFIEQSIFGLINQITAREEMGARQAQVIVHMLMGFAEKNPGMTRVLTGDALVNEDERLQERINQLVDRIEASLKQSLRIAASQGAFQGTLQVPGLAAGSAEGLDPALRANLLISHALGRWQRYARSGFRKLPTGGLDPQLRLLLS
ncbi:MAG: nucleoid occlusion factor SlmA [Candidatus Protistobacter heckmanni]|nr:nucleoid occlusion factor SlmA [Candidatus Protistobacter heckmanni]